MLIWGRSILASVYKQKDKRTKGPKDKRTKGQKDKKSIGKIQKKIRYYFYKRV